MQNDERRIIIYLSMAEAIICETALSRLLAENPADTLIQKVRSKVSAAIVIEKVVQRKANTAREAARERSWRIGSFMGVE
jgi:hypothetical protein